jgi:uncharacterized protein YggE
MFITFTKGDMMKKSIIVAVLASLMLGILPPVWAEPDMSQPSEDAPLLLTITGESSLDVHAEQAQVLLSVISEHERFKEALHINQTMREEAIEKLTHAGITPERIQESALSSTPQYGFIGKKPKSYTVENLIRVVIVSEHEFQAVAQIVDDVEQVFYRELTFTHPKAELKRQVIALAHEDLAQKKRLYEDLFGVTLMLKSFTTGSVSEHSPFTGLKLRDTVDYSREIASQESPIVTFGELLITGQISATYVLDLKE